MHKFDVIPPHGLEQPACARPQPLVRRWSAPLLIFIGCVAVYHANGHPIAEVDCIAAPYTAWSLCRHLSLDLSPYQELAPLIPYNIWPCDDGRWLSIRRPGSALVALPLVAPLAVLREAPLPPKIMLGLGKVIGALCVAAAVVIFWMLCRRLVPAAAVPATLLFAFGTCLWSVASQALWTHAPATLWVTCALALLLRRPEELTWKVCFVAGLALGLAVLSRSSTALFALPAGLALVFRREWRAAFWLACGGAGPILALCLVNWLCFGDVVRGGYAHDNWGSATPLTVGLPGLLVAPSRGLLVYSPALLLAPLGLVVLLRSNDSRWREQRALLVAFVVGALLTIAFHARWYDWWGGWSYGPRTLCEITPIACLLFGVAYAGLRGRGSRHLANALVGLSIVIHFVGVAGHSGYVAWQERHNCYEAQGRCLFSWRDTQIGAHARAVLQKVRLLPKDSGT